MKIAVSAETHPGESRVAATPDTVKAFVKKGIEVAVEAGAGAGAFISDDAFAGAGAKIAKGDAALEATPISFSVSAGPTPAPRKRSRRAPSSPPSSTPMATGRGSKRWPSRDLLSSPWSSCRASRRAQSMDVLSSQANLAGYKAVIDAAAQFGRAFPMMMTAAGTVPPAKVFIMGVGVAGLQAIATARRLGAIVSATDVRKATEEQVKSLGAKFVFADVADAATAGGYAQGTFGRGQGQAGGARRRAHEGARTSSSPPRSFPAGRRRCSSPQEMVETMKPGSVIVDLAVERGGNCPLAKPGEIVTHKGVTIMGNLNLAGRLAGNASPLYARNLQNFLDPLVQGRGAEDRLGG